MCGAQAQKKPEREKAKPTINLYNTVKKSPADALAVANLQFLLWKAGYYKGMIDGNFGRGTGEAVYNLLKSSGKDKITLKIGGKKIELDLSNKENFVKTWNKKVLNHSAFDIAMGILESISEYSKRRKAIWFKSKDGNFINESYGIKNEYLLFTDLDLIKEFKDRYNSYSNKLNNNKYLSQAAKFYNSKDYDYKVSNFPALIERLKFLGFLRKDKRYTKYDAEVAKAVGLLQLLFNTMGMIGTDFENPPNFNRGGELLGVIGTTTINQSSRLFFKKQPGGFSQKGKLSITRKKSPEIKAYSASPPLNIVPVPEQQKKVEEGKEGETEEKLSLAVPKKVPIKTEGTPGRAPTKYIEVPFPKGIKFDRKLNKYEKKIQEEYGFTKEETIEFIVRLQQALKLLGFYNGKIDGIYGKNTIAAVKKLQEELKIKQTGIFDNETRKKLKNYKQKDINKQGKLGYLNSQMLSLYSDALSRKAQKIPEATEATTPELAEEIIKETTKGKPLKKPEGKIEYTLEFAETIPVEEYYNENEKRVFEKNYKEKYIERLNALKEAKTNEEFNTRFRLFKAWLVGTEKFSGGIGLDRSPTFAYLALSLAQKELPKDFKYKAKVIDFLKTQINNAIAYVGQEKKNIEDVAKKEFQNFLRVYDGNVKAYGWYAGVVLAEDYLKTGLVDENGRFSTLVGIEFRKLLENKIKELENKTARSDYEENLLSALKLILHNHTEITKEQKTAITSLFGEKYTKGIKATNQLGYVLQVWNNFLTSLDGLSEKDAIKQSIEFDKKLEGLKNSNPELYALLKEGAKEYYRTYPMLDVKRKKSMGFLAYSLGFVPEYSPHPAIEFAKKISEIKAEEIPTTEEEIKEFRRNLLVKGKYADFFMDVPIDERMRLCYIYGEGEDEYTRSLSGQKKIEEILDSIEKELKERGVPEEIIKSYQKGFVRMMLAHARDLEKIEYHYGALTRDVIGNLNLETQLHLMTNHYLTWAENDKIFFDDSLLATMVLRDNFGKLSRFDEYLIYMGLRYSGNTGKRYKELKGEKAKRVLNYIARFRGYYNQLLTRTDISIPEELDWALTAQAEFLVGYIEGKGIKIENREEAVKKAKALLLAQILTEHYAEKPGEAINIKSALEKLSADLKGVDDLSISPEDAEQLFNTVLRRYPKTIGKKENVSTISLIIGEKEYAIYSNGEYKEVTLDHVDINTDVKLKIRKKNGEEVLLRFRHFYYTAEKRFAFNSVEKLGYFSSVGISQASVYGFLPYAGEKGHIYLEGSEIEGEKVKMYMVGSEGNQRLIKLGAIPRILFIDKLTKVNLQNLKIMKPRAKEEEGKLVPLTTTLETDEINTQPTRIYFGVKSVSTESGVKLSLDKASKLKHRWVVYEPSGSVIGDVDGKPGFFVFSPKTLAGINRYDPEKEGTREAWMEYDEFSFFAYYITKDGDVYVLEVGKDNKYHLGPKILSNRNLITEDGEDLNTKVLYTIPTLVNLLTYENGKDIWIPTVRRKEGHYMAVALPLSPYMRIKTKAKKEEEGGE